MLYFVGVGPGDPELITMKAVRILQEADAIAIPDSGKDSVVWKIAGKWMEGKPICRLSMPMKGKKEEWEEAHRKAAETLLEWLKEYKTIAYLVLGDPGIYASSSYLMKRIAPHHLCKVIPGVPAMCAVAAELGIPLCEQGEDLYITDSYQKHSKLLHRNTIVMKVGKQLESLRELAKEYSIYAAKNIGMADSWMGEIDEFPGETASYFMTAIIKTQSELERCVRNPAGK